MKGKAYTVVVKRCFGINCESAARRQAAGVGIIDQANVRRRGLEKETRATVMVFHVWNLSVSNQGRIE
jgi:hypothetical protein